MGLLHSSYEPAQQNPTSVNYVAYPCQQDISSAIYRYIYRQSVGHNAALSTDIMSICQLYIGYICPSTILNEIENCTLYELLMQHLKQHHVISPLMNTKYIKQFALLFRYRARHDNRIQIDCHTLIQQCRDRQNLLMLFRTEYDHVFGFFFQNKFTMPIKLPLTKTKARELGLGPRQSYLDHFAMFLLRSNFEDSCCPKTINLKDGTDPNYGAFKSRYYEKHPSKSIGYRHFMAVLDLDDVGNEICGGNHTFIDTSKQVYRFELAELELFQIF